MTRNVALGIDIGGSGIKGALVDLDAGDFASDRLRIETPQESTPANVAAVVGEIVTNFADELGDGPIGLTIPVVAVASILLHQDLVLGLEPKDIVLLTLTILVSLLTFGTGRTNILFGFVHLVIFATFAFLVFVP